MSNEELLHLAFEARERAYAPYSNWKVGAALLTKQGKVYLGCNIENSGFSATVCAERTAFFKAVSEGCRDFAAIAISAKIRSFMRRARSLPTSASSTIRPMMIEGRSPTIAAIRIVAKTRRNCHL